MNKLLQFGIYGIKNIEKLVTIDLCNQTIERGIKGINNVKGIFGYNGSGKSALLTGIYYYKNIICSLDYLIQNNTKDSLSKLINYKTNEMYISMKFEYEQNKVINHIIKIKKDILINDYIISYESIGISSGRTINDSYDIIYEFNSLNTTFLEGFNNDIYSFSQSDLIHNSIINLVLKNMLLNKNYYNKLSLLLPFDKIVLKLYSLINNINVFLNDSDLHNTYKFDINVIKEFMNKANYALDNLELFNYLDDEVINKTNYNYYLSETKKMFKFIKLFKPDLKKIELRYREDGNNYHIKKLFIYDSYKVEYEYESSGIKQLVKLYSFLDNCSNGGIVFIDEIDTNLNSMYFEKLVLFFKKYGQGQIIFTTHNIETMKALKDQYGSIVVLGNDCNLDIWVGKGNRSPMSDYSNGNFLNSPMNIEDFDFINVFLGE